MNKVKGFSILNGKLNRYTGSGEDAVIPEGVTVINRDAFNGCTNLKSVVIPPSVSSLESGLFDSCRKLKRVTIEGDKVTGIKQAFPSGAGILFLVKKLSMLSPDQRRLSVIQFAKCGGDCEEPYRSEYWKHMKTNASKYISAAIHNPVLLELMIQEKLIPEQAAEAYLEGAREIEDENAVAMIQDYIANHLSKSRMDEAKKKKCAEQEAVSQRKLLRGERNGIEGRTFAVTGDLKTFEKRTQLKEFLLSKGASFATGVSAKVDYLIRNDDFSDSEKTRQAGELGIEIITEAQFNAMAERQFHISSDHVLVQYVGPGGDVVIPEGVTAIGDMAFRDCGKLTGVVIAEGITSIGDYAFYQCTSLKNVAFPQSLTAIGFGAFSLCGNLDTISLPAGLTSIGSRAFSDCGKLTDLVVPKAVTAIGDGAFLGCRSLRSLMLPDGMTAIADHLCSGCEKLTSIAIGEGGTSIGFWAFNGCSSLTRVLLPGSMVSINKNAFDENAKILFLTDKLSLLSARQREQSVILFAENFNECDEPYRGVYLKHIKMKAADYAQTAMNNLRLLELMHQQKLIPAQNAEDYLKAAQQSNHAEAIALMLDYSANHVPQREKEKAERAKETARDAVFERKLRRLEKKGIEGLTFVTTSELKTFEKRGQMKALIESKGGKLVTAVSPKVDYLIMNPTSSDKEKEKRAKELGIEIITEREFNDLVGRDFLVSPKQVLTGYVGTGGDLVIPKNATAIGREAFAWCQGLARVLIPNRVSVIGERAFYQCTALKEIVLSKNIKQIAFGTFQNCVNLERVNIPEKVLSVGQYAFEDCKNLTEVVIWEGVYRIEGGAFAGCTSLTRIFIPGSVKFIDPDAFKQYTALGVVKIPNLTIYAPSGSYAESYADKYGIPFAAESAEEQ